MKPFRVGLLYCAFACLSATFLSAASISLDTVGADPDLTSPFFTFEVDAIGNFNSTYRNVSNPAFDFVTLTITAPFTPAFYATLTSNSCSGGHAFAFCGINSKDSISTVVFTFSGLDSTHFGIPYNRQFGIVATSFEPEQIIGGAATTTTATPEPAALWLALIGLGGLALGRKKLLKFGVRP